MIRTINHLKFAKQCQKKCMFLKECTVLFSQTITSALKHACEILTEDSEGGAAQIPFDTFQSLYTYLAHLDGEIPKEQIDSFLHSLEENA